MKILKNSNKRQLKIGLLTSSRADYGIYKPLLKKISQVKAIDLTIIAFGMHLKKKYGQTINDINRDNGKQVWSYSDVFNKYQRMYQSDSLINKILIFVIICIVLILIFFLYNIYDGKKVSRKQSFF